MLLYFLQRAPPNPPLSLSLDPPPSFSSSLSLPLTGQKRMFVSGKVGSMFTGKPQRVIQYGDYQDAVIVEVGGRGHYLGEAKFWFEADDELSKGFLVK